VPEGRDGAPAAVGETAADFSFIPNKTIFFD
jgi:hypothetical protein